MARTDITTVRGVLSDAENDALSDAQVQSAIDAATLIVDGFADADCHTDDSLKAVETYLAADIAVGTTGGGTLESEKIGDASEKKALSSDNQSQYWRTATLLDCSNQLIERGKRNAGIFSVGSHGAGNTRTDEY